MRANENVIGSGTAFVVMKSDKPYLITNWHNLSGRNPATGKPISKMAAIPEDVQIMHNHTSGLGKWISRIEPVLKDDTPLWLEHPIHGNKVDVVCHLTI